MEALKHYVTTPTSLSLTDLPLSGHKEEDTIAVLTYENAGRTVLPVVALLPEDPLLIPH